MFSAAFDLEKARRDATKARVQVDEGVDPAETLREEKQRARSEPIKTFDDLAQQYFTATETGRYRASGRVKRASTLANEREVYRIHIQPTFAKVRPETVTRAMVRDALETMLNRGVTSQANKAQAIMRQMLAFAVDDRERLGVNPIAGMSAMVAERARTRVYADGELKDVWRGICHPESLAIPAELAARRRAGSKVFVGPAMRLLIQLAILLLQRKGEIAGMARSELDLEHGVWLIPEGRMKTRRAHAVPLSPVVVELIREAIALTDGLANSTSKFVFPSRVREQPISGPSINNALGNVLLALGIENGTVHDFRRTGSTRMTSERLNVSHHIRSQVLGHLDSGGGSSVSATHYDSNSYMDEKRRALDLWQALVLDLVG